MIYKAVVLPIPANLPYVKFIVDHKVVYLHDDPLDPLNNQKINERLTTACPWLMVNWHSVTMDCF